MKAETPNLTSYIRPEKQADWKRWTQRNKTSMELETKLLSIFGVISAPVLTLLVDVHTLAPQIATDIGSIVAAVLVGFHGNDLLRKRKNNVRAKYPNPPRASVTESTR